jgi:hypothetical protein
MSVSSSVGAAVFAMAALVFTPACHRGGSQDTARPVSTSPLFQDIAQEAGLNFHYFNGATGQFFFPEMTGGGVAFIDYDGDGDLDVYLIQSTLLNPEKKLSDALIPPPNGWRPGNRLFRNMLAETGKLTFVDVTDEAGVGHVGFDQGVAVGDYDGDGHPDLYVTGYGHNVLYHNNGNGTFTDVTAKAGVDDTRWSTSATFCDYDGDGLQDLFVAHYVGFLLNDNHSCYTATGEHDYCGPRTYRPETSRLFRNMGNGRFSDVSRSSGITSAAGPGLGVACADFNGDGRPDFLVANDGAANHLWINQGNGTFREAALEFGIAFDAKGSPHAGMGIAIGDADNAGSESIFISNLNTEGGVLYNRVGNVYVESSIERGLQQATVNTTGFGTGWLDYDNDSWLDLFVANGAVHVMEEMRSTANPFHQLNQLFHNEGAGKRFREVSGEAGPIFQHKDVGRSVAFGDLDNDGGVDIVVSNDNGPLRLLRNVTANRGHWLEVSLMSAENNRAIVNARVGVFRPGVPPLWRRMHTDASYLSASDPRLHFGLGVSSQIEKVEVVWPDGGRESWSGLQPDRVVTLRRGSGSK